MSAEELEKQLCSINKKLDEILILIQIKEETFIPLSKREPDNLSLYFRNYIDAHGARWWAPKALRWAGYVSPAHFTTYLTDLFRYKVLTNHFFML